MRMLLMLAVVTVSAAALSADNPETAVERSHERARRILDAAVEAMGGREAVEAVKAVRIRLAGEQTPRLQMTTPEPPYSAGHYQEETVIDLERNRLSVVQSNRGGGFRGNARIVLSGGKGQTYDLLNRTATAIEAANAQQQQFAQYQRRLPALVLRTALQREASLRYLGEDTVNGTPHHAVTFVHVDGVQMALYVDAKTNLITKYELIYPDAVTGDEASEIFFDGYRKSGPLMMPSTFRWLNAGEVVARWKYDVELNPQLSDALFDAATDGFRVIPANAPQLAAQRRVGVEKLGDGAYLVVNLGGGAYNVLAVEFSDHIVVVEAPLNSQVGEQAIAEIKKAIPGKPVRFVAMTHHHGDHSGGVRAFVAEGASVVTTGGNAAFTKSLAASTQLRDALARNPKPLKLELVVGRKRVFSDGTQTLELHDIGPMSHAKEMLVAYLPKQGIVFQGDLFFSPFDGLPLGFAQQSTREFAARIRDLGFRVEKLAGTHGKVGTMSELEEALELAKKVPGDATGTGSSSEARR